MRLKLTAELAGDRVVDLAVTADANATVADVAAAVVAGDPSGSRTPPSARFTIRILHPEDRVVPGDVPIASAGIRSGQRVAIVSDVGMYSSGSVGTGHAATLTVVAGPDAGRTFPLRFGATQVGRGRGNDLAFDDPLVSKAHARITVGDQVEVVDLGSANGVMVHGSMVGRSVIGPSDHVTIGDTTFTVVQHAATEAGARPSAVVEFNRSPHLDPVADGQELKPPQPPAEQHKNAFPVIPMIAPALMGCVLFLITRNPTSVVFVALSPLMMVGSFVENRFAGKRAFARDCQRFRAGLQDLEVQLHYALEQEGNGRRREHPSTDELVVAARSLSPLLWSRRPDRRAFLQIPLGRATLPSRTTVVLPDQGTTTPELWKELRRVVERYGAVDDVPVAVDLRAAGSLGISGPSAGVMAAARAAVLQMVLSHSPAELILCALLSSEQEATWRWLTWLPHTSSEHSPVAAPQIAVGSGTALVAALEELVAHRCADEGTTAVDHLPAVVVLVDDRAAVDRSRLVQLMERATRSGVHLVWMAAATPLLPAACRTFLHYDAGQQQWVVGDVVASTAVGPVVAELISVEVAEVTARAISPVVDAGAQVEDQSGVPARVSFLTLTDPEVGSSAGAVVGLWRASSSLPAEMAPSTGGKAKAHNLRAFIGATAADPLVLDLREHGPHALVGGTTGSGKSEFLQTWVLGMAIAHSPARVNFLFVDYKGGSAFAECIHLPHCVGMVTDLSPYLVRRALVSLKAELRHREMVLHRHRAKDLIELEAANPQAAPPSLVIVIDEFAALVKEVPDFVDGVVDVAQRGRSLGLHLILATQRPAGVIRDNLRANTNLRVALRMADEEDSVDVVGTKTAAYFDPSGPGRGVAKVGPGRLLTFQTGYVGGWTTNDPPRPQVAIEELRLGGGPTWEQPVVAVEETDPGPNDLQRIVQTVRAAATAASIAPPRKPWQPELAHSYELSRIRPSRSDQELVFGILDDPANQAQVPAGFRPDDAGNMAVYGTGGSGKSAFLRSLAVAAGATIDGPCHVYGLDFGTRGLSMLEALPHVGAIVNGDDQERIERLLRTLRAMADDRTERWDAAGSANSIAAYRRNADRPDEPRVLVLVDNFGALRQALETSQRQVWYDTLQRLISEGRQLGIHFVLTADRSVTIPPSIMASVQRRLVLRLSNDNDYSSLAVPSGQITPDSPPGRGSYDGMEVQVAVLGGVPSTGRQSAAIQRLAVELRSVARWSPAPGVPRLPDEVRLADLPPTAGDLPTLGLADATLGPIGFDTSDPFLLIGPPQARPEQALLTLLQSWERCRPGARIALLSLRRSSIAAARAWAECVTGADEIKAFGASLPDRGADLPGMVAIDGLTDLANSDVDFDVQSLLKALSQRGVQLIALADSFQIMSAYGCAKYFKGFRNGLALLPEQQEGDGVFSTAFPRVARTDFRPNTGFLVRRGSVAKVLAASPS